MNLNDLKTLTGLNLQDLAVKLDEELPGDAYSPVPGGALDLTDISPAYMRQVLTQCFGICGIGWGYHFDVQTRFFHYRRGEPNAIATTLVAHPLPDPPELLGDTDLAPAGPAARAGRRPLHRRRPLLFDLPRREGRLSSGNHPGRPPHQ